MFAIVLIAVAVAVRLVIVVRNDRPLSPPRSHTHEVDQHSTRLLRVV
jgi:HAMP domain-containing protein